MLLRHSCKSIPSKRLVYYQPPPDFFELYPELISQIWQGCTQLFGDVEAGLSWNNTFVPWLCQDVLDLQQTIFDPCLLFSPSINAAMWFYTDDTANVIPADCLPVEERVTERFKCRDRLFPAVDLKVSTSSRTWQKLLCHNVHMPQVWHSKISIYLYVPNKSVRERQMKPNQRLSAQTLKSSRG